MFEKVNPSHPDKIADRIAGALVDLAYKMQRSPRIAVEVLIGHGKTHIVAESSVPIERDDVEEIVNRIAGPQDVDFVLVPQDEHLATNQKHGIRCGDNGVFRGVPVTFEQQILTDFCRVLYKRLPFDGKTILDIKNNSMTACWAYTRPERLHKYCEQVFDDCTTIRANPLGMWFGGTEVDTGATNRKLGSDMGDAITGGGLHGKDLSKADVTLNIYAHLKAQLTGQPVELTCSIGDAEVDGHPYSELVAVAHTYIRHIGGFEKLAEWGLIR